jgi:sugar phosphate isomerase/epimerase
MRIGFNTWSIATVPYQVFIPELHKIGYTSITISVIESYGIGGKRVPNAGDMALLTKDDRRRIREECERRGLELSAVVGNQSLVGDDPERIGAAMQRLKETIDFCVEVAPRTQSFVPTMNTGTGGHTDDFESRKQQIADRLGELAAYGAERDVVVCLEPHVNGAIDTIDRSEWVVTAVDHPHCALDFDVSHFEVGGFPLDESVRRLAPLAKSVEIKDQNTRLVDEPLRDGWRVEGNGLGRTTSPAGRPMEFQFLLGGEGDFDLTRYLRLMQESGWTGAIGFEASVACQARPGYDGIAAAATTYRWMADGWERAGISKE